MGKVLEADSVGGVGGVEGAWPWGVAVEGRSSLRVMAGAKREAEVEKVTPPPPGVEPGGGAGLKERGNGLAKKKFCVS